MYHRQVRQPKLIHLAKSFVVGFQNSVGIEPCCIHLRKTYICFSRHYSLATDKVFKEQIFQRV